MINSYDAATQANLEMPFQLTSISQVAAPAGCDGTWQQYLISQGSNIITGMRCGTHVEVSALVNEMVERLNERFGKQRAKMRR
jgi:hypothetical protein